MPPNPTGGTADAEAPLPPPPPEQGQQEQQEQELHSSSGSDMERRDRHAAADRAAEEEHVPDEETMAKVARVRKSVIGSTTAISGPFGKKPIIYADYTASGRAVSFIEDFIRDVVLPMYANTHTEASATGLQTTEFREEARDIVREACGGIRGEHAVIFTGSGSTAAIAEMIGVLNIAVPHEVLDKYGLSRSIPEKKRPVVFVGPYEHHSNEVSWRETLATVVTIPADERGHVDVAALKKMLRRYRERPLKVGSFSAGSNVTGVLTDVPTLATTLHEHGALAFFDYAAAAPYVDIDMQLRRHPDESAYLDAVFISPHKFAGGPGTPGVLVARTELFHNASPVHPGGGTVEFVSPTHHKYKADIETREEGGTPEILGSIRCGLVFKLKMDIGVRNIHALEMANLRGALKVWRKHKNILLLGNQQLPKLTITSFVIRTGDRFLHHNFVVALLNDLFGIQSRGGCSCAGPYGHRLLHVTDAESEAFAAEVAHGFEGIKPGWARLNFPYFLDEHARNYIIDAVTMIADHGWKLLPDYVFDVKTGLWQHRDIHRKPVHVTRLHDLKLGAPAVESTSNGSTPPSASSSTGCEPGAADVCLPKWEQYGELTAEAYATLLAKAREELEAARSRDRMDDPPQKVSMPSGVRRLRWFALPTDFVTHPPRTPSPSTDGKSQDGCMGNSDSGSRDCDDGGRRDDDCGKDDCDNADGMQQDEPVLHLATDWEKEGGCDQQQQHRRSLFLRWFGRRRPTHQSFHRGCH